MFFLLSLLNSHLVGWVLLQLPSVLWGSWMMNGEELFSSSMDRIMWSHNSVIDKWAALVGESLWLLKGLLNLKQIQWWSLSYWPGHLTTWYNSATWRFGTHSIIELGMSPCSFWIKLLHSLLLQTSQESNKQPHYFLVFVLRSPAPALVYLNWSNF